jgi:hypothetical protein
VGLACAKILHHIGQLDVTLIDASEDALRAAAGFDTRLAVGADALEAVMRDLSPTVTICNLSSSRSNNGCLNLPAAAISSRNRNLA